MKMQCAFFGVPTALWSITKRYGDQKTLSRHSKHIFVTLYTGRYWETFGLIILEKNPPINHTNIALRLVPSEHSTTPLPSILPFQPDIPSTHSVHTGTAL